MVGGGGGDGLPRPRPHRPRRPLRRDGVRPGGPRRRHPPHHRRRADDGGRLPSHPARRDASRLRQPLPPHQHRAGPRPRRPESSRPAPARATAPVRRARGPHQRSHLPDGLPAGTCPVARAGARCRRGQAGAGAAHRVVRPRQRLRRAAGQPRLRRRAALPRPDRARGRRPASARSPRATSTTTSASATASGRARRHQAPYNARRKPPRAPPQQRILPAAARGAGAPLRRLPGGYRRHAPDRRALCPLRPDR